MSTQGTAVVEFGSGKLEASIAVTGQGAIVSGSLVEACPALTSTSNNPVDGAKDERLSAWAGDIIAATGFTIYVRPQQGLAFGQYNIFWVWN